MFIFFIANDYINVNSYMDVVPSNQSLSGCVISVSAEEPKIRNKHLKNFVDPIKRDYNYIILDMAPAVDIILENIVDDLIIVAVSETYAVKNAETTLKITDDKHVTVRNIVPTKIQLNTNTHKFMLNNLKEVAAAHHIKITDTYIPNLIAFSEAVSIYELPLAIVKDSRYKWRKNIIKS